MLVRDENWTHQAVAYWGDLRETWSYGFSISPERATIALDALGQPQMVGA